MAGKMRVRVLSEQGAAEVHRAALNILAEIGILVQDDDTRRRLNDLGCGQSDDGYTLLGEDVVAKALATVPPRMVLYNQRGEAAVDTGDHIARFGPGLNCTDVLDFRTGEHRPCVLSDVVDAARLCDKLPHVDLAGNLGNPTDLPAEDQALASVRALAENTEKPLAFIAHDEKEAEDIWSYLAGQVGGWDALEKKPIALDLTGPTSPLKMKQESARRLRLAASRGLPVVCYPALMPGIGGPVTLAGALAQSGAEILAGLVIHQMERPGAPVISGSAVIPFDMRMVNLAYGSPEYVLAGLAASDYFQDLGVPTWIGAGCTDSNLIDAQAAAEAGFNIMASIQGGTAFAHNLGYLSSGLVGSLEMLVLGDELAGMARRVGAGIEVNEDTLAVDIIRKASKTGKYLTEGRHTARHTRTEYWIPSIFQRQAPGDWRQAGAPSSADKIREKIGDLIG